VAYFEADPGWNPVIVISALTSAVVFCTKVIYELIQQAKGGSNGNGKMTCQAPSMPERLAPILDRQTDVLYKMNDKLTELVTLSRK
jgi:hypothetical protein